MNDPVLSLVGLAMKAGAVKSGSFQVSEAVKSGRAKLVIISEDASARTVKDTDDMCKYYGVRTVRYGSKDTLGQSVGKDERSALAITEEKLADAVLKKMED